MRLSKFQVKHLYKNRERHRKIDVGFGDVLVASPGNVYFQQALDEERRTATGRGGEGTRTMDVLYLGRDLPPVDIWR